MLKFAYQLGLQQAYKEAALSPGAASLLQDAIVPAAGAGIGALVADEGDRGRSALKGGLLGLGYIGGMKAMAPVTQQAQKGRAWLPELFGGISGMGAVDFLAHPLYDKNAALETRMSQAPAAGLQQAPSAATVEDPTKGDRPMSTQGWIQAGQTVSDPARNAPISLQ